ncbi:electron transfer flavoprotein subunit alpha [Gordonibacter sp. An230]|uniref:electron transfer flavoprotein subunit alpha/FixB family protein n=1 Tax=Gordonibacter sp. An230 TaxID=1965592 RepID=UPI000B39ED32|nr:electron transfer flavoprotein subunit alpha/FixB family protein [Gordonibacter sp. An230]OUO90285.1 electron transfer flavoprotein subunit alpha [Gordonibacter sp. An230]
MKVLVIAEHADVARELAGGARSLGADEVSLVCFGGTVEGAADTVLNIAVPEGALVDDAHATLAPFAEQADVTLVEATRRGKVIAGRLAAKLGAAAPTATVALTQDGARGTYFGGVAERVQKPATGAAVYLVAAGVCDAAQASGAGEAIEVAWVAPKRAAQVTATEPRERTAADPTKSDVVVACGRGFAAEKDLQLARDLAGKLGGAIACTRPLTEGVNWLPTELYVGVSGLTVTPKVYVAAGVSGQMQHMVGCNRSGVVVAVNKDKNAPVFKQCDYGIVGDVKEVLPALTAAL